MIAARLRTIVWPALLGAFACAGPNPPPPPNGSAPGGGGGETPAAPIVDTPQAIADGTIVAVPVDGRWIVELRAPGPDDDVVTVARLRGVRLATGNPATLPLASCSRRARSLVLTAPRTSGHVVAVTIRSRGPARARVQVRDDVGLRSATRELTVDWELAGIGPATRLTAPAAEAGPDLVAGDETFRAPVTAVHRGPFGLVVVPDLAALATDRRLPQAIEVDEDDRGPYVRHGLIAHDVGADGRTRRGGPAVELRAERVGFEHEVAWSAGARPIEETTFHGDLWRAHDPGAVAACADESVATQRARALDELVASWQDVDVAGRRVGTFLGPDGRTTRFRAEDQALRVAYALATARPDDARARELADRFAQLLLLAPDRSGLIPRDFERVDADESRWTSARTIDDRGLHWTADAASTAYWLLHLGDAVPERRAELRALAGRLGSFLLQNQARTGRIPAAFDAEHLLAVPQDDTRSLAATAWSALLLAELTRRPPRTEPRFAAAARRAIDAVVRDLEARAAPVTIANVIRAAATLDGDDAAALAPPAWRRGLAGALARRLFRFQQAWNPPWRQRPVRGGFGGLVSPTSWNDPLQALLADAMLRAYELTGEAVLLDRGAAGLRAAVAAAAADAPWPSATLAIATATRARLGDGVVDVTGGFAHGLDAVWFEDVSVTSNRVSFRLLTTAAHDRPVRVCFRRIPPELEELVVLVDGSELGSWSRSELEAGIDVPPRRIRRVEMALPAFVSNDESFAPRVRLVGPRSPATDERPNIATDTLRVHLRLPDSADYVELPTEELGDGVFTTARSLPVGGLEPGDTVLLRAAHFDGLTWRFTPVRGWHRLGITRERCADPGDDDERYIVGGTDDSRVDRFVDGRQNARFVAPGASLQLRLPVESAARVEVEFLVAGSARIASRGQLLHEDPPRVEAGPRRVELDIADARLLEDGALTLDVTAGLEAEASIARVHWLAAGERRPAGDVNVLAAPVEARAPDARMRALVIPIGFPDQPAAVDPGLLRQVFFGGSSYRQTPAPTPRLTAGSIARLVAAVSGGSTTLTGDIAPTFVTTAARSALEAAPNPARALLDELRAHVEATARNRDPSFDIVIGVHAGEPLAGTARDPSFALIPARGPDGSVLAGGDGMRALLTSRYDLLSLGEPRFGAFGSLALSAPEGGGHIPVGVAGINMQRIGWADVRDVLPPGPGQSVGLRMRPLQAARTIYRLPTTLPGRGDLHVEVRSPSAGEPGLASPGVIVWWQLPPGHEPWLIRADGRTVRPRILRLSPRTPKIATPFEPATAADLFTSRGTLDGASVPSVATLEGEAVWHLHNLVSDRDGAALEIGHDLDDLLTRSPLWLTGRDAGFGPLTLDGIDRGLGVVEPANADAPAAGYRIAVPGSVGQTVRARFDLPADRRPRRLFVQLGELDGEGSGSLRVSIDADDGGAVFDVRADFSIPQVRARGVDLELDVPPSSRPQLVTVDLTSRSASPWSGRLARATLVPRARPRHSIRIPAAPLRTLHLADGGFAVGTPLRLGGDGVTRWATPVPLPAGRHALRVIVARPFGDVPGRVELDAVLRDADGRWERTLFAGIPIDTAGPDDPTVPRTLVLTELPVESEVGTGFLELAARGPDGSRIALLDIAIDR